jgi:excisionase family DNA binding protein
MGPSMKSRTTSSSTFAADHSDVDRTSRAKMQKFFTRVQIAEMLDVDPKTVSRWIKSGALAACRIRGVLRIAEADLKAFLAAYRA